MKANEDLDEGMVLRHKETHSKAHNEELPVSTLQERDCLPKVSSSKINELFQRLHLRQTRDEHQVLKHLNEK